MNIIKTPNEMLLEMAGIPHMKAGGQTEVVQTKPITNPSKAQLDAWVKQYMPAPPKDKQGWAQAKKEYQIDQLHQYGSPHQKNYAEFIDNRSKALWTNMVKGNKFDNPVSFYRPNPKNLHGAKDYLETMPTTLDADRLAEQTKALRAAEKYGGAKLTPQQLKTFYALEGRSDMGFNGTDFNNAKALEIAEKLKAEGHPEEAAYYAAALYDKNKVANRTGISLQEAWNGTGTSEYGKTGMDYKHAYDAFQPYIEHPKNAELDKVINTSYNWQDPYANKPVQLQAPQQQQQQQAPQMQAQEQIDPLQQTPGLGAYKKGGAVKPEDMFHEMIARGKTPSKLKPKK